MKRIKVIVDSAIPFIEGVLERWCDVVYLPGADFTPDAVSDADALVIRTRTRCNAGLLEDSGVKFIATATIGTDHIDLDWCSSNGIEVFSAQGCNSGGVMQYVFTALSLVSRRKGIPMDGKTLGVIGVGNVGSKVALAGMALGFNVLTCDPPRKEAGYTDFNYLPLQDVLERSDIVTLHVPLDQSTRSMADNAFFDMMRPGALLINASRGPVVVDSALKAHRAGLGAVILDVWNGEPDIDRELLAMTDVATMHIAGYSRQGKVNGTVMCVRALAERFGIEGLAGFSVPAPAVPLDMAGRPFSEAGAAMEAVYDLAGDDAALRSDPSLFEKLRNRYNYRDEFIIQQR